MSSEVVYAEVSPKERVHFTSQTSDTGGRCAHLHTEQTGVGKASKGDPTTYAEMNVKWRSDRPDSPPKTTHTVTCLANSHWCYVAVTLYFTAVVLLITVILLAVKCHHL